MAMSIGNTMGKLLVICENYVHYNNIFSPKYIKKLIYN